MISFKCSVYSLVQTMFLSVLPQGMTYVSSAQHILKCANVRHLSDQVKKITGNVTIGILVMWGYIFVW
jgi:hypothetical protein